MMESTTQYQRAGELEELGVLLTKLNKESALKWCIQTTKPGHQHTHCGGVHELLGEGTPKGRRKKQEKGRKKDGADLEQVLRRAQ